MAIEKESQHDFLGVITPRFQRRIRSFLCPNRAFLLRRWIEEGDPGFISGHNQFAEMLPATDFFDTMKIGLADADTGIFHGRGGVEGSSGRRDERAPSLL